MRRILASIATSVLLFSFGLAAQTQKKEGTPASVSIPEQLDAYLKPYVESNNFSGAVLAKQDGKVVFERAYGLSSREGKISNTADSRFHIASVSMQFTAAAILRLVDAGMLTPDTRAADFAPSIKGAEKITLRDLLTERSGLPDINELPEYNDILQRHQTPSSLLAAIEGRDLLFEPGTKFLHEEHSAYNLLALILEKKTGLPFAEAIKHLVFDPAGMQNSTIDDDSLPGSPAVAAGYQPEGAFGLRRAQAIHWSGKTGNASAVTTVEDETKLLKGLLNGPFLSAASRSAMFGTAFPQGYGWFKRANQRFGETVYYMNGRAPGFGAFVLYLPQERISVVLFSNIYSSATSAIGYDLAAILRGLPYQAFRLRDSLATAAELKNYSGAFQFGPDFYQKDAQVSLVSQGQELALRWPSGDISPLIPVSLDEFVDRSYWERVKIERDAAGQAITLLYGSFRGAVSPAKQP